MFAFRVIVSRQGFPVSEIDLDIENETSNHPRLHPLIKFRVPVTYLNSVSKHTRTNGRGWTLKGVFIS
jgi:hypothetical protein